eukprot:3634019-Amphidinium_carterae.1
MSCDVRSCSTGSTSSTSGRRFEQVSLHWTRLLDCSNERGLGGKPSRRPVHEDPKEAPKQRDWNSWDSTNAHVSVGMHKSTVG